MASIVALAILRGVTRVREGPTDNINHGGRSTGVANLEERVTSSLSDSQGDHETDATAVVDDVDGRGATANATSPRVPVAALLLAGGASRRMGRDKTRLVHEGRTLAQRTARLLTSVCDTAIEVGPGGSGLDSVVEEPPGEGPLAAIVAGRHALRRRGHDGPALVVASDLPFLTRDFLAFMATFDASGSVVAVVEGRTQPLCARWSCSDLDEAGDRYARGERSLRFLADAPGVVLLEEPQWRAHASPQVFLDVDTPDEARRYGLIS
ncbi:MAG: molybdenum cofactor guanylyltransferase [Acidobacteriota bacterium]|nr:molybdenum cofactor guanylyltransferase [Acidobacteriota bacterium]